MFFRARPNPTKSKHVIYLASATLLGVLLSVIVHVIVEAIYLQWADQANKIVTWYGGCSLHPVIQVGLVVLGAVGGFFLGRMWWQYVYIDRRWANDKKDGPLG